MFAFFCHLFVKFIQQQTCLATLSPRAYREWASNPLSANFGTKGVQNHSWFFINMVRATSSNYIVNLSDHGGKMGYALTETKKR